MTIIQMVNPNFQIAVAGASVPVNVVYFTASSGFSVDSLYQVGGRNHDLFWAASLCMAEALCIWAA